jgi:hypothetical protein
MSQPKWLTDTAELIDKCVGSSIWVLMKSDKGPDLSFLVIPPTVPTNTVY